METYRIKKACSETKTARPYNLLCADQCGCNHRRNLYSGTCRCKFRNALPRPQSEFPCCKNQLDKPMTMAERTTPARSPLVTTRHWQSSMTDIPVTIMTARLNAGLTQKQLGEKCGYKGDCVPSGYVSGWESGVRPVPMAKLKVVAEALGIKVEKLLP